VQRVFENPYYTVDLDDAHHMARIVRTREPFPSIELVRNANRDVMNAVLGIGLKKLLVDLRDGPPGRNDPEFERATDEIRENVMRIKRVALLVRTQAGRLQALRLSPTSDRMQVFLDENEALDYLKA
jgi:hypothetical protein